MTKDPNFAGYHAKIPVEEKGLRERLRQVKREVFYGAITFPYGVLKHKELLRTCDRVDNHTYTCFLRAPAQLAALEGPILEFLGNPERTGRRLEILTFACSNGAEVYTMAAWLTKNVPTLDFHITASDLHHEMVARCKAANYSAQEALQSDYITKAFLEFTFDQVDDRYIVKPEIRARATFTQASLLDATALNETFAPADIVTAQNVLFHLKPQDARHAFENVVGFLKPRSVLLVEGMDLDLRAEMTMAHDLKPLEYRLKEIYSETRVHTPPDWWKYYWGTEPYFPLRLNKARRYATIFLKSR